MRRRTTEAELREAAIAEISALLANLNGDLGRMPSFKRGTRWHLDRLREKRRLLDRLDVLREQKRRAELEPAPIMP